MRRPSRPLPRFADPLAIAVTAVALRLGVVLLSNGGLAGFYGYDAGVYFSAADAMVHGRLPYRDFELLHPPLLPLVLTPFAVLGRLTTDLTGYVAANLFMIALSAGSAVLVWRIVHAWGFGRRAALFGGLFYATWWGAINAEIGVRLEPLGTFLLLAGLLLITNRREDDRWRTMLGGAAFGAACCVKIWWAAPLLVVLTWHLAHRRLRRLLPYVAGGAVASAVLISGPFAALAGTRFFQRVVTDQLGRSFKTFPWVRIQYIAGLRKAFGSHFSTPLMALAVAVVALAFLAVIALAWQHSAARLAITLLVVQFLVLCTSPSFFNFYSAYVAGPLALTVAAAAAPGEAADPVGALRWRRRAAPLAAALSVLITLAAGAHSRGLVDPFPGDRFHRASAGLRCVMTDANTALILMNRLSDDLAHGCPNWVDVTGRTYYGPQKAGARQRAHNLPWQRMIKGYLLSGDAVVTVRPGTGLSPATDAVIRGYPALARGDGYVLRRVTR